MEQIKKPNPYSTPGTRRVPMNIELINKAVRVHASAWLLNTIMDVVCTTMDVTREEIHSKKRIRNITLARHLVRYYAWEILGNQVKLGDICYFVTNGRNSDHSIVINSRDIIHTAMEGRDQWANGVIRYMHEIDSQLNKIYIDESNSSHGSRRQR